MQTYSASHYSHEKYLDFFICVTPAFPRWCLKRKQSSNQGITMTVWSVKVIPYPSSMVTVSSKELVCLEIFRSATTGRQWEIPVNQNQVKMEVSFSLACTEWFSGHWKWSKASDSLTDYGSHHELLFGMHSWWRMCPWHFTLGPLVSLWAQVGQKSQICLSCLMLMTDFLLHLSLAVTCNCRNMARVWPKSRELWAFQTFGSYQCQQVY